jgi:hypothetical protein
MVRLVVLLLLALAGALVYLHLAGFPPVLQEYIRTQLARAGVACQYQSIHLRIMRGVVIGNAVLADAREPDKPLARVDQLALSWSWRRLWNRQQPITGLRIANATISLPLPADEVGQESFTASEAFAELAFNDDDTIDLNYLTGLYCGIRLQMSGRIQTKGARAMEEQPRTGGQFTVITKVLRQLHSINASSPPQLELKFDLDLAQPLDSDVTVRLRGNDVEYRQLTAKSVAVDVSLRKGAIQIEEARVQSYGGEMTLRGSYDLADGGFDLSLFSSINPMALLSLAPPAVATNVAREVHLRNNPRIELRYTLSPETGSLPRLKGSLSVEEIALRDVPFKSISCDFSNQGPQIWFTNAVIVMAEGRATGSGKFHIESSDFEYEFDSTLDPKKLEPLLFPVAKRIIEPSWFQRPPHLVARVRGDFVDPNNFAYDAELTTEQCSYRGVPLQSASAKLRLREGRLAVNDLWLARAEGELRGTLVADFDNQLVSFDLETTANPWEMAGLLGPKAAQVMRPYRFGPRTQARMKGLIDFLDPYGTAWTARAANDGFSYWKFTAEHAEASLTFTNQTLTISDFDADFYSGKLRGNAGFVFEDGSANYRFEYTATNCDVQKMFLAMRGPSKGKPVTGLLSAHGKLEGSGTDLSMLTGSGNFSIGDGILWQAPIFGIFSQILGDTKATDAKATFTIENEAFKTSDLEIAAGVFTAEARGQLNFNGDVNFRVKAKFLRNWLGIGWLGQILGEILEYKVGGTISNPKYQPVNLPKELLPHDTK